MKKLELLFVAAQTLVMAVCSKSNEVVVNNPGPSKGVVTGKVTYADGSPHCQSKSGN